MCGLHQAKKNPLSTCIGTATQRCLTEILDFDEVFEICMHEMKAVNLSGRHTRSEFDLYGVEACLEFHFWMKGVVVCDLRTNRFVVMSECLNIRHEFVRSLDSDESNADSSLARICPGFTNNGTKKGLTTNRRKSFACIEWGRQESNLHSVRN